MFPLLAALMAPAHAADVPPPFGWQHPAASSWHLEATLFSPRGTRYYALNNLDARAGAVGARADVTCAAAPRKKDTAVTCTFDWIELAGKATVENDQAVLDRVLDEWEGDFKGVTVEFTLTPDGRMKGFDVDARERQNKREAYIIEAQRALAQRLFCLFDLSVPADGNAWKKGWKVAGNNEVMKLQTITGTSGASEVRRSQGKETWGLLSVTDEGRGTLSPGGAVDSAGTRLIDVRLAGMSLLDPVAGSLVWREVTLDGRLTTSSQSTGTDVEFFQASSIQRIERPGAPGEVPLSVPAQRAPRRAGAAPAVAADVALVPFADLKIDPFFVKGMPDEAKSLDLPKTVVKARVEVGAEGRARNVRAYEGFEALAGPTENALLAAAFPVRAAPYAVDVDVEWRPAAAEDGAAPKVVPTP